MEGYRICGGGRLAGELEVQGSKNGVLPLLAAALLTGGVTVLRGVPALDDVFTALEMLRALGCAAEREGDTVTVDARRVSKAEIPASLAGRMRSSVLFLAPLLIRCGEAKLALPGGCKLGARPIDLHLAALRAMGAFLAEEECLVGTCARLRGARIRFPFPSVGATEQVLLAAACAEGETVLENAAREPEIGELCRFLRRAGAKIAGEGTARLRITGVPALLSPVEHRLSPDRIAAATFLCAAAATGGAVRLKNVRPAELTPVLGALARMGAAVELGGGQLFLRAPRKLVSPGRIVTGPYPGFPTDAQPLLAASCLRAAGTAEFRETVFENRFRAFAGFRLLGAEAEARGMTACITGVRSLRGTRLLAEDLRGGAALVIAALSAEGESLLLGTEHIRRGYENLPAALRALGAEMETEFAPACGA